MSKDYSAGITYFYAAGTITTLRAHSHQLKQHIFEKLKNQLRAKGIRAKALYSTPCLKRALETPARCAHTEMRQMWQE